MKKGWTATKLIAIGGLALLQVTLALSGASIQAVTGIPITAGILNGILAEATVMICLFVTHVFGAATLLRTINGLLILPLATLGTPGFLPKVPIAMVSGILIDILYYFLRKWSKRGSAIIIGGVNEIYYTLALVWVGRLFSMPGIEWAAKIFLSPLMIVGAVVIGALGGYLGWLIYQKIKDTSVVKRIQGE